MAVLIVSTYAYVLGVFAVINVKYVTVRVPDLSTNHSSRYMYVTHLSSFYVRNKISIDVFYNYLLAIAIPTISLIVVSITTSIIVYKLRASLAWHRHCNASETSAERRERAVTSMLVTVCVFYVICITPSVTFVFTLNLIPDFLPSGRYCNTFKACHSWYLFKRMYGCMNLCL